MPLVLFVGANNHRASVVFACALLADEKESTFDWLMETFVASMKNQVPKTVITDGDERLHKALGTHLKAARRRLCAWHIGRNIGQKVKKEEVQKVLGKLLYASYSVEEWQLIWDNMIAEHDLMENEWMKSFYDKRERWAEAFFRGHHCAGMCSTQRCEGMNNKVKTKVGSFTKLVEFVPRLYDSVSRLRDRYLLDDFKSQNHLRKFELPMKGIEEQIFNIFTDDIYLVIRGQMVFENSFVVSSRIDYDDSKNLTNYVTQYGVEDRCWLVTYVAGETKSEGDCYTCSCGLFESDGIPCCHIFTVFKTEGVKTFPKSLICKRWTKDARKKSLVGQQVNNNGIGESQACRYAGLIGLAKRLCYNMSFTEQGFESGMEDLNILLGKYPGVRVGKKARLNLDDCENVVQDPVIARTKGSHVHITECNGQIAQPLGKGPRCGHCHNPGHNRRRCPDLQKVDGCKGGASTVYSKLVSVSEQRVQSQSGQRCESNAEEVNMSSSNLLPSRMPYRPMFASPTMLQFDVGRECGNGVLLDINSQVGESDTVRPEWG